jgi:hypothetical protein
MAQAPSSWWDQFGPGLLGTGVDLYGQKAAGRQQTNFMRDVRGPQYGTEQALAGRSLALAGNMDPNAAAAKRYTEQQALMAPGEEAQRQELMRMLHSKGLLGLSSHGAIPGVVTTPGQPVNPYVASLLAAQQTQRAKSAYDSLNQGEAQLDRLIGRSNTLQQGGRAANLAGLQSGAMAPKPSLAMTLLKGASGILKDPRAQKGIWELLKGGAGMLGNVYDKFRYPAFSQSTTYRNDDYEPGGYDY